MHYKSIVFAAFLDHETACRRNGADFAYEARFA